MSDHEQLHEQLESDAARLERESERLGEHVEEAKEANQALEADALTATPLPEPDGDGPPPEAQYPAKD